MVNRSSESDTRHILIPLDILARMSDFDPVSEASISPWLRGLLKDLVARLDLEACLVLISKPAGLQILAKHGIKSTNIDRLMERIKDSEASRSSLRHAERTSSGSDSNPREPFVLEYDDRFYTVIRCNLLREQSLWCVFATTRDSSPDERRIFDLLAIHIARIVTIAHLVEQARSTSQDLEKTNQELKEMQVCSLNIMEDLQRKNRDLSMLNALSQEMAGWTSLPELTKRAVEAASNMFDGATAIIYVKDDAKGVFTPYQASPDFEMQDDHKLSMDMLEPLTNGISKCDEILFDTSNEAFDLNVLRSLGAKTGLLVPLCSKSEILGILLVCETRWHRIFTEEERENLRVLTSTVAVAMENASLLSRAAKQVEEMSTLKEYIETVVDSVDLGIMVIDTDLRITMLNKGFEKLYGYKKEHFLGRHVFEAFSHLMEQGFTEIAEQVLNGKPFVRYGWRRKILSGTEAVQNFRIFPHRDAMGKIVGAIVIVEDVTEKANLEDQLARSEAKFSRLVENLDDGYLIVVRGRISYANKAVSELTGIPAFKLLGIELKEILPDDELCVECSRAVVSKLRRESKITHSTGTWIPVEISTSACEYGGAGAVSMVIRDITERKRIEHQLEQRSKEMRLRNEQITRLNQELEATVNKLKASQESLIKSERAAAITETSIAANHEINNPLFAILGQAQLLLLKREDLDEETVQRLKTIEESALRIACVTKKLANLADPVVKEYAGLPAAMIDIDKSTTK